ncbi:uncharacterized protein [Periplaneta americana]|uniref:uncharacterized protein n=1 Tax=Periplaneta americana TaxID=6978 RepID=UPI0037E946B3
MDLDENTNVLDEVEILFKKLESLPESLKRAAFNKIQEKLPQDKLHIKFIKDTALSEKKKRPGRKRKVQAEESGFDESKESETLWFSEYNETEFVVENVLTSRGRKAKRISYAYMHEYGRNQEETSQKTKKTVEENDKEKKEVQDCDSSVDIDLSGKRQRLHPKKVIKLDIGEDSEQIVSNIESNTVISSEIRAEQNVVLIADKSVVHAYNNTQCLEHEDSEVVDDPSALPAEAKQDSLSSTDQQENSVIGSDDNCEKEDEKDKDVQENPRMLSNSVIWRKRKVPRTGGLACQDCNFTTSSRSLLEIHSRRHTGIKPYVCPDCGKAFPQSSGLNVHIKRHKGQRDYPCDYCEYSAYTKVDKIRHMTIHTGERNQVCQYCGKAFAKDSTLREHVRSIHERPFKHVCSECGFTTYRANNLRVHVRMRHRGEYNNHVCPVCGARVKQRNAFLEHMRAHTGEKPFRCDQCESSFACLARLTVHRKSVHEPRQFPCTQCRKTFQTKHHLSRHTVIHTKAKPFSCPFCTYSCNTQGNMTKHVKTIHHMPHFSYRKYKADQESESSATDTVNQEWVEKGQRVTEQYLKDLSTKLGRDVTLDELRARENEKQKRINDEAEQAKIKRMNRIHTPEHSYHTRVAKITSLNSKSDTLKLEGEEVVDPATLILQVAAQNADNFVNTVNEDDLTLQTHIVKVDLLSGIDNEGTPKNDSSQVTVAPHIVQMLSNMNSDENCKGNTQVIHIQTSDSLQENSAGVGDEYETVILPEGATGSDFVTGQVYQLVSGQNLRLCLNAGFVETEDGNTLQVLRQDSLAKRDDVYNINQESEEQIIDLGNSAHFVTSKEAVPEDTVVVIINTDHSQENSL